MVLVPVSRIPLYPAVAGLDNSLALVERQRHSHSYVTDKAISEVSMGCKLDFSP